MFCSYYIELCIISVQFLKILDLTGYILKVLVKLGFHIDVGDGDDGDVSGTFLKC